MKILSLRCSNSDFTYALISGGSQDPVVEEAETESYPKSIKENELFYWFYQEIKEILQRSNADVLAIKAAETTVKRSNALELRMRIEGVALMVSAELGFSEAYRKIKSTIAKDLGLKGKGKYLETQLDTSSVENFNGYTQKKQEAILVGWSCLS